MKLWSPDSCSQSYVFLSQPKAKVCSWWILFKSTARRGNSIKPQLVIVLANFLTQECNFIWQLFPARNAETVSIKVSIKGRDCFLKTTPVWKSKKAKSFLNWEFDGNRQDLASENEHSGARAGSLFGHIIKAKSKQSIPSGWVGSEMQVKVDWESLSGFHCTAKN